VVVVVVVAAVEVEVEVAVVSFPTKTLDAFTPVRSEVMAGSGANNSE
jgi:hypothetical protein